MSAKRRMKARKKEKSQISRWNLNIYFSTESSMRRQRAIGLKINNESKCEYIKT